LYKGTGMLCS